MNRTIQNPKRVSIIVDSETLGKVRDILGQTGTSFSFFVRRCMSEEVIDAERRKGGKNVQENEKP